MDPKSPEHYTNRRPKFRLKRAINSSRTTYALYTLGILISALTLHYFILSQSYSLTPAEARLLSKTAVDNGQVSFKDGTLSYNQQNQSKDGAAKLTVSGATNSTSKQAYRVALASKVSSGIKFTDANSDLPFKLIPLTSTSGGRYINGHMVYPSENAVGIYTLRRNGIKEDIILNQSPGASYSYAWKLQLGTQLEARMLPDGGVGIYSANPLLNSSTLQVSDAKSQALIDKAKKAGKKDTLIYVIPAPYITQSNGVRTANNVRFNLSGSTLTLTATSLDSPSIHYPISIDPTVVVTTTADFATGYDDGNIDYSTADEIDRAGIGTGLVGTWNYTSNSTNNGGTFSAGFTGARSSHTSVAYNGYLYVIGGSSTAANDCTSGSNYCNGVQYAPINADGTIGAWHFTHNSTDDGTTFVAGFMTPRYNHTSIAYNGYLYILGGKNNGSSSDDCAVICNGVQYAPINSNGTVGAWNYTHNSTNDGTTFVAGFNSPRSSHTSVAYNGYLYVIGGQGGAINDCANSGNYCNGVQFAPINANGTIGTWNYTHNSTNDGATFVAGFIQPRYDHSSVAYNGYLYITGGFGQASSNDCNAGNFCSGVEFAKINADGSIGAWNFTSNSANNGATFVAGFIQPRYQHTTVAYDGYLYIVAGLSGSGNDCGVGPGPYTCNGAEFAPINANGTVGAWHYTHNATDDSTTYVGGLSTARYAHTAVVSNGYIYVLGGSTQLGASNDCTGSPTFCNGVLFASLTTLRATAGPVGTWNYTSNSTNNGATFSAGFNVTRQALASVAYNGYVYVLGGLGTASTGDCDANGNCRGVQYASINADGTVGAWHYTHAGTDDGTTFVDGFSQGRTSLTSVAYNGYLYIMGGQVLGGGASYCASDCNDIQFAPINANGTVGAWHFTSNSADNGTTFAAGFMTGRSGHNSVVYNGYLYVIGGGASFTAGDCSTTCSGVQYAPINANGTIGAWHFTHNSTDDNTTFVSGFTNARSNSASVAYKGYLYLTGGSGAPSTADCDVNSYCGGVQYAKINANGTIGAWHFTHNSTDDSTTFSGGFLTSRWEHGLLVNNGYLYILGGQSGATAGDCSPGCAGVQFAKINANGTVAAWNYTHNGINDGGSFVAGLLGGARNMFGSVVNNGYMYILGGQAASPGDCGAGSKCNGVQFATISSGTVPSLGTINSFTTSSNNFTSSRYGFAATAYNGYLYIAGGDSGTGNTCNGSGVEGCNDVQYAKINSDGSIGPFTTSPIRFTDPRFYLGLVAYNGYLYIVSGQVLSGTCNGSGSNGCNDIQYVQLASDGSIASASFTTNSNRMVGLVSDFSAFTYNGYLYTVGNSYNSQIEYAKINANGTIGTFTNISNPYASGRANLSSTVYNGYIYLTGGYVSAGTCNGSGSGDCNDVQYAKINSNGSVGNFTTSSNRVTGVRRSPLMKAYNGYLYVAGGYDSVDVNCNGNTSGYCNDIQYAQINSDGSIGSFSTSANRFTNGRYQFAGIAIGGNLYITGGYGQCTGTYCSDVQYTPINSPEKAATYEKTIDISSSNKITSLSFNGTAVCGMQINYRVGNSSGSFGSVGTIVYGLPATTYTINQPGRYLWVQFKMDDAICGTNSQVTDFTVTYNVAPNAPTLSSPANSATGVSAMPALQLSTTDADSDSVQFWIDICSNNTCGSIVRSICQVNSGTGVPGTCTASQTGWNSTTYASGATATYTYQVPALAKNTQYWWRAYALDPSGSTVWGSASTISTFTTGDDVPAAPVLVYPVSASSGNSVLTTFQLRSTENNSDYLRYWIDVCADSACSSIIRSICQQITGTGVPDGGACTPSQTGWSGQDQQAGTAYSGNPTITLSQLAVHNYQSPYLTKNTTYWWRAYAIDPGGSNTWSASSAIQSFTTAPTETHLQGTIKIQGSVKL